MTMRELVACLQGSLGSLRVIVNGYDEDYDDLTPEQITRIRIGLNSGTHEWEGVHGHPGNAKEPADVVEAVVLQRTSPTRRSRAAENSSSFCRRLHG